MSAKYNLVDAAKTYIKLGDDSLGAGTGAIGFHVYATGTPWAELVGDGEYIGYMVFYGKRGVGSDLTIYYVCSTRNIAVTKPRQFSMTSNGLNSDFRAVQNLIVEWFNELHPVPVPLSADDPQFEETLDRPAE